MAHHAPAPRRTSSFPSNLHAIRIGGGVSLLVLVGVIVWDLVDDSFWAKHTLFTGIVASLVIIAVTGAVLNEVLERRQRERWAVLAQYALFDFVNTARHVWSGLLELAGLVPDCEPSKEAIAAGAQVLQDTPRVAAAFAELMASPEGCEQLHRLINRLRAQGQAVLGRWAAVMVNSGSYAEIVDRHVELYSRLYWWGSVLDESDPLEEHLALPRLSRISPATQTVGRVEDEWLRDNLVAIAQLAESLERSSFELAMRIVPLDWWVTQLPDRPATPEPVRT